MHFLSKDGCCIAVSMYGIVCNMALCSELIDCLQAGFEIYVGSYPFLLDREIELMISTFSTEL